MSALSFSRAFAREDDELTGRVERGHAPWQPPAQLCRGLDRRLGAARRFGFRAAKSGGLSFDARQRAIVKVHYFGHGGGGAAALKAHARYIARDAAGRDGQTPHGAYLDRGGKTPFYDRTGDGVDGRERLREWADSDRRHFRIIIAPENGAAIGDLRAYVREVMARAEDALGLRLAWVAIDHWDTDNPHTHVVLRGKDAMGRPLVLPREFVKYGLRNHARDAATERLGARTPADERRALGREARAHRPTRLDAHLARFVRDGRLHLRDVRAPGEPELENALKTRARELERLGLAETVARNVLHVGDDWRGRLAAMELHLDIRKRLVRERALERTARSPRSKGGRDVER